MLKNDGDRILIVSGNAQTAYKEEVSFNLAR